VSGTKVTTGTVRVSRTIKAPPERVYNAFLDPDAMVKWLPPHGFTGKVHHMDARVGGTYRMSFSSLNKKWTQAFGGKYLELTPHTRIRYTDSFETDVPEMKGEMVTTITFTAVEGGTRVDVEQTGVPKVIPVEAATAGWGQSLDLLQALVEAPDFPPAP
jgi:uncharacterized protein YndB with AHSA1/START domain